MGKIMLEDGAFGTSLWEKAEALGEEKLPVWIYNIQKPEMVLGLSKEFIENGSQIINTNTFGANRLSVSKCSDYTVEEVVKAGVNLAIEAAKGTDTKLALSAGPLTQMMEPYGDLTEEEVAEIYDEVFAAGFSCERKPDYFKLQTFIDLNMLRVAAETAKKYDRPIICTMSFEPVGKTMFGNSVEDIVEELEEVGVHAIGINCTPTCKQALPILKELASKTKCAIEFKPNVGKPIMNPDGTVAFAYTPEMFAEEMREALPYATYIGGCCGCNADYVTALKKLLEETGA